MSLRHTLLALVVVVVWGSNFVIVQVGMVGIPPLLFVAARFFFVAVPAVFFLKPPRIGWKSIALIGATMSLGQFGLLYFAIHLGMPPGLASLLLQTQVIFTIILAVAFLRERPTVREIVGVLVGMAGLAIVVLAQASIAPWVPIAITLGAALAWATGNVIARRAKAASGLSLVVWSAVVVPVPALVLSLILDGPDAVGAAFTHITWAAVLSTAYTVIASSFLGYGIWNTLLAKYPASSVVPFSLLIPVVGIAVAWIAQGEVPGMLEILGGVVMLAGLALAVLTLRRRVIELTPAKELT